MGQVVYSRKTAEQVPPPPTSPRSPFFALSLSLSRYIQHVGLLLPNEELKKLACEVKSKDATHARHVYDVKDMVPMTMFSRLKILELCHKSTEKLLCAYFFVS